MSNAPCVLKCKNCKFEVAGLGGAAEESPEVSPHMEILKAGGL